MKMYYAEHSHIYKAGLSLVEKNSPIMPLAKAPLYPLRIPALNFYSSTRFLRPIHFDSLKVEFIQSVSVLGKKKRINNVD